MKCNKGMLIFLVILCWIVLSSSVFAAQKSFQKTLGGPSYDVGNAVHQTTDGGFIIAGTTTSYGAGGEDVYLVKTDANGRQDWERYFGSSGNEGALTSNNPQMVATSSLVIQLPSVAGARLI